MITTRQVNVMLRKLAGKNKSVTTNDVKLPKVEIPESKNRPQPVSISTAMLGDIQGIKDKQDRAAIMKERKAFQASEKKPVNKILETHELVELEVEAGTLASKEEIRKLNMQYVFVDIFGEDVLQGFPRSELKNKKGGKNA